jgi:hypothetical protein
MFSMDPETQRLLRKVVARMDESRQYTGELTEDELTELIELEMRADDSPDDDEPDALVTAPLRPQPDSDAGAFALPEPDDPYPLA